MSPTTSTFFVSECGIVQWLQTDATVHWWKRLSTMSKPWTTQNFGFGCVNICKKVEALTVWISSTTMTNTLRLCYRLAVQILIEVFHRFLSWAAPEVRIIKCFNWCASQLYILNFYFWKNNIHVFVDFIWSVPWIYSYAL